MLNLQRWRMHRGLVAAVGKTPALYAALAHMSGINVLVPWVVAIGASPHILPTLIAHRHQLRSSVTVEANSEEISVGQLSDQEVVKLFR